MGRRPREPDWDAIRDGYAAGKSAAFLAASHGVSISTLQKRASTGGWGSLRKSVGKVVAENLPSAIAAVVVDEAALAIRQQLAITRAGLEKAATLLTDITAPIPFAAWSGGVKALVQTQRLALGLGVPVAIAPPSGGTEADGPPGRFVVVDPGE